MPSNDLVLDVRQIAGYSPATTAIATDAIVLQRGGLGGPYKSISPPALIGTALAGGGDMAIGGTLSVGRVQGGSAQFSNASHNLLFAQKAEVTDFDAQWATIMGVPIATQSYVDTLFASGVRSVNGRSGDIVLTIWDVAGAAPIHSPRFTGEPRAWTPSPNSCSDRLATTAFVHGAIVQYINGFLKDQPLVFTFNGRSGDIVLTAADIEAAAVTGFAPIDSPAFTGLPTAPTPAPGTSNGLLATTAFVMNAVTESTTGVVSFNTRTGAVVLTGADLNAAGGALLNSPFFTGNPQGPTAPLGTATAQLATTAFVMNELGGIDAGVVSFNGRNGAVLLTSLDITNAGGALAGPTVTSFNSRSGAVSLIANDVSAVGGVLNPNAALTGVPTAPTAGPGTSTTQIATTAFVMAALASVTVGVTSFNTRTGAVTLNATDITGAGGALQTSLANYVPLAGNPTNPMTGNLAIANAVGSTSVNLNRPSGYPAQVLGTFNNQPRWAISLGNSTAESGSNAGSDFGVSRYNDAGALIDTALFISRANANAIFSGAISASGGVTAGGTVSATGSIVLQGVSTLSSLAGFLYSSASFAAPGIRATNPNGFTNSNGFVTIANAANLGYAAWAGATSGQALVGTDNAQITTLYIGVDAISDIRLKENIRPTEVDALAVILSLPVRAFDFRKRALDALSRGLGSPPASYHTPIGLVAQEVEAVIPEMVAVATQPQGHDPAFPDDPLAVILKNAVPYLLRAMQQLAARVEALEASS